MHAWQLPESSLVQTALVVPGGPHTSMLLWNPLLAQMLAQLAASVVWFVRHAAQPPPGSSAPVHEQQQGVLPCVPPSHSQVAAFRIWPPEHSRVGSQTQVQVSGSITWFGSGQPTRSPWAAWAGTASAQTLM
jgi:hypothetical protein